MRYALLESIAHGATILSSSHCFCNRDIAINDQSSVLENVHIGDNVWIGAKATILAGTAIGSGSVIGAGAVVLRDIPGNTVCAGVPARMIKES